MRLHYDKSAGYTDAYYYRKKAFCEAFHIVIVALHILGYDKYSYEFKYLGGLYRDGAHLEPAGCAVYRTSHYANEYHQARGDDYRSLKDDFGEEYMIVDERQQYHSCKAETCEYELALYEVVAVAVGHLCGRVCRRKQHNKPESEQ